MNNCTAIMSEQFFKRVDEAKARELVLSVINAVKEQVQYAQAQSTAERAVILFRKKSAGQIHALEAKIHYENRNSQLRYVKHSFAKLLKDVNESQKKRCAEFLNRGGLIDVAIYGKQKIISTLLEADIRPSEARSAIKKLDVSLEAVKKLTTLKEIDKYFQQHVDELIAKKIGNPPTNGFCVLLLILTSMFAILLLIAALICAFTFGLVCEGLLDRLIENACGS